MSSRRHIQPNLCGLTVVVGWDNPLSTFFAEVNRVQDKDDARDPVLLWIGTSEGEVPLAEELVTPLAPFAELTPEAVEQLRTDRAADANRPPTHLQRTVLELARPATSAARRR
jgi:hypothetical protein